MPKNYVHMDKLTLLKLLREATAALEELSPHFTQRREIKAMDEAIEELES